MKYCTARSRQETQQITSGNYEEILYSFKKNHLNKIQPKVQHFTNTIQVRFLQFLLISAETFLQSNCDKCNVLDMIQIGCLQADI